VFRSRASAEIEVQTKEAERRLAVFRGSSKYDLKDKTIVIIDDGVATGATMIVTITWIKKQKPRMVILAIPVAPSQVVRKFNEIVDRSVVLHTPSEFSAVGEFYEDFAQISDDEVIKIISDYKK